MTDDIFKQTRKKITPEDLSQTDNPLQSVKNFQNQMAKERGEEPPANFGESPFQIGGQIPPEFREALARKGASAKIIKEEADEGFETFEAPPERPRQQKRKPVPDSKIRMQGSDAFETLIGKLTGNHLWEKFEFPSKGKFYTDIPGVVDIRPMTGEEEQILATPRFVKKGKAIDMIFARCIKQEINTEELLSVDRTNLLIFLRGISYTPEYDVEIKCPNCATKFAHVIELDDLEVRVCGDEFSPDNLHGTLPSSGFKYSYRLATGRDEQEVASYREKRIAQWGDQGEDDTLLYRTALLLEEIEGVTMKKELSHLLKKLPIQDVAHLRNEINQPPFGVDTSLPLLCPNCMDEFKIDLPMEANFFFPKKKEEKIRA